MCRFSVPRRFGKTSWHDTKCIRVPCQGPERSLRMDRIPRLCHRWRDSERAVQLHSVGSRHCGLPKVAPELCRLAGAWDCSIPRTGNLGFAPAGSRRDRPEHTGRLSAFLVPLGMHPPPRPRQPGHRTRNNPAPSPGPRSTNRPNLRITGACRPLMNHALRVSSCTLRLLSTCCIDARAVAEESATTRSLLICLATS